MQPAEHRSWRGGHQGPRRCQHPPPRTPALSARAGSSIWKQVVACPQSLALGMGSGLGRACAIHAAKRESREALEPRIRVHMHCPGLPPPLPSQAQLWHHTSLQSAGQGSKLSSVYSFFQLHAVPQTQQKVIETEENGIWVKRARLPQLTPQRLSVSLGGGKAHPCKGHLGNLQGGGDSVLVLKDSPA